MVKVIRPGKCVVVLSGRYAGHKAVVLKAIDSGTKDRPYGHCLIAGVARYPRRIVRRMSKTKISRRSHLKAFLQTINYNHVLPTRYAFDTDAKFDISPEGVSDPRQRGVALTGVRKSFQDRFLAGKNPWFFQKLLF